MASARRVSSALRFARDFETFVSPMSSQLCTLSSALALTDGRRSCLQRRG